MKNLLKNVQALIKTLRSRIFAVGILSVILACTVYTVSMRTYAVYINDGDQVLLRFTMKEDPEEILEEHGITTIAADVVDFSGFIDNEAEINIKRAFSVNVTADGETKNVMLAGGTVADALRAAGVSFDLDDEVSKGFNEPIENGEEITLKHVEYNLSEETQTIPYEVVEQETPTLIKGVSKISEYGEDGERHLIYRHKIVDGKEVSFEVVRNEVTVEPKNEVELIGTVDTVSDFDFGYTLDGVAPSSYRSVMTNVRATGYSAHDGAGTASGRPAMVGNVAVNPDVIPYGTRLYITSADGSFVYGYAIAADTGTALMDGRVGVDLFYNTYEESCQNGVKRVNIYILD